ncbi:MAG TPA: relaxase MobL, partial [Blastocatellia bacterium]
MRVVVAIKSTGGSGAARATRYIAERDRDKEREGEGPRPLFSEREDSLTYRKANQVLSRGHGTPEKGDLIHFSVSFQPEDYEQLGETDKERQARLREVATEALAELKDDLGASEWRWVAGIHLNTEHPHLHILISKEITDRETGQPRRLGRIPKRLLPHRESNSDGTTRPVEGIIGEHFVAVLDRHIERARKITEFDRSVERDSEHATVIANGR